MRVEHDELVTRDATDYAAFRQCNLQPVGDGDEHVVTSGVTEAVVDVLEPVDVDEHDGRLPAVAPCRAQRRVDVLEHERAVGEAGECIGLGTAAQLLLQLARACDGVYDANHHGECEHEDRHHANGAVGAVLCIGDREHDHRYDEARGGDDEARHQR
jgi:hypothetical protein